MYKSPGSQFNELFDKLFKTQDQAQREKITSQLNKLAKEGKNELVDAVVARIDSYDSSSPYRLAAYSYLAQIQNPRALEKVLSVLKDELLNPRFGVYAQLSSSIHFGLSQRDSKDVIDKLRKLLSDVTDQKKKGATCSAPLCASISNTIKTVEANMLKKQMQALLPEDKRTFASAKQ